VSQVQTLHRPFSKFWKKSIIAVPTFGPGLLSIAYVSNKFW